MCTYKKSLLLSLILVLFTASAFAGATNHGTADSTQLGSLNIHATPQIQPYMLAQGIVSTYDWPYYVNGAFTTLQRCGIGTHPVLTTSIKNSYINSFYAIGGITNTLNLGSDYTISGSLYLDNRGAVASNTRSPATANWQIWCQPLGRA